MNTEKNNNKVNPNIRCRGKKLRYLDKLENLSLKYLMQDRLCPEPTDYTHSMKIRIENFWRWWGS